MNSNEVENPETEFFHFFHFVIPTRIRTISSILFLSTVMIEKIRVPPRLSKILSKKLTQLQIPIILKFCALKIEIHNLTLKIQIQIILKLKLILTLKINS